MPKHERGPFVAFPKPLYDAALLAPFTHTQLLVLLALVRWTIGHYSKDEGNEVSLKFLERKTQLHRTSIRAALSELKSAGVVHEVRPASGRRAALLAVEPDPSSWGRMSPGNERPKRRGNAAAFVTGESVACATDAPPRRGG